MTKRIILSGFGGQGILSAGLMLGEAGLMEGLNVTYYPSYGAEMRGGTANCHVILSDEEIASPIIDEADVLIAMNQPSINKFIKQLKKDGLLIINSSVVKDAIDNHEQKTIMIPIEDLAFHELGNPKVANVIILGAFIKATRALKLEEVQKSIEMKFIRKSQTIIDLNKKALMLGYQQVTD